MILDINYGVVIHIRKGYIHKSRSLIDNVHTLGTLRTLFVDFRQKMSFFLGQKHTFWEV